MSSADGKDRRGWEAVGSEVRARHPAFIAPSRELFPARAQPHLELAFKAAKTCLEQRPLENGLKGTALSILNCPARDHLLCSFTRP